MTYWMNEGIGISSDVLRPHLDKRKCMAVVAAQCPDLELDEKNFDLDDYMYYTFVNLGDFMCHVDNTGVMSYGDNGYGVSYFLYQPTYPWNRRDNEPQSIDEVHTIIVDAIMKVTNLTAEEADKLIDDDIYEYGCG